MSHYLFIVWNVVRIFPFAGEKVGDNFKITLKIIDFFFCQKCYLTDVRLGIIKVSVHLFRIWFIRKNTLYFFWRLPMLVPEVQN